MRLTLICLFSVLILAGSGRDPFPRNYFQSPLGIPLSLSGNFAEMRSNHFHAGLDIRTNGQVGYRVYSAAQGYVARIAVSPGGYGHALYVNHPNGYQTVYAHLSRFEEPVASWVREQQYARRSFNLNLFPEAGQFPVEQREVIAYSGNSGGSGGPHLHFEIRDAATAEPLNPLLFGIEVADTTTPRIFRVKAYAAGDASYVRIATPTGASMSEAGPGADVTIDAVSTGPRSYGLDQNAIVHARGRVGFAIQTHDYHEGSSSRLGVFTTTLTADGNPVFASRMERFSFSDTRYINAHLDYAERVRNRRWIQRSHVLPGNRLRLYDTREDGYLNVLPGDTLRMLYVVEDVFGNKVRLPFTVVGTDAPAPATTSTPPALTLVPGERGTLVRPGFIARFPTDAVYDRTRIAYRTSPRPVDGYSLEHLLHDPAEPLHAWMTLSITTEDLPAELRPRAVIARRVGSGGLASIGGTLQENVITARTRSFGTYVVAVDTLAPTITPLNISPGADLSRAGSIRLRMRDDFSGIASYEGRINGQWALFEYDAKTATVEHPFDGRFGPGDHELEYRVTDGVGHTSYYRARFRR